MLKRTIILALTAATAALTLAGCSLTPSDEASKRPAPVVVPEASGKPGSTSQVGTTELNLTAQTLAAEIPAGQALYLRGTVAQVATGWTATIVPDTAADADSIIFTNGGTNADGTESQPTIQAIKPGKVTVLLVNSADPATTITVYITVTTSKTYEESKDNFTIVDEERLTIQEQAEAFAKSIIGKTEEVATKAIWNSGFEARVVTRDGKSFPGTTDFVESRINLTVKAGKVTGATVG